MIQPNQPSQGSELLHFSSESDVANGVQIEAMCSTNEKPRFEIIDRIGHGQFSNVYKARWINAPLTPAPPASPGVQASMINPLAGAAGYSNYPVGDPQSPTRQFFRSPLEVNSLSNQQLEQPAQHRTDNKARNPGEKYVALKRIKFCDIQNSKLRTQCVEEVKLLQQLRHPNIINYIISFIQRNELFIALELADGGDLSKLINYFQRRKQLLSERIILKYFTQICSAVQYIHSKRILHRDIKPANIFMTSDGVVKLGDFGLGRFFSQNTLNAHSIVGTFYYMSPERILESGYGFSSDVWSLGCVLYELITLHSPFSVMNIPQPQPQQQQQQQPQQQPQPQPQQNPLNLQWLIDRICRAEYPSLANYHDISLRLRQLTTECLNPVPDARPNMDYVCAVVSEAYRVHLLPTNM